jgi:tetratricopeptide (TPR) repeat protein
MRLRYCVLLFFATTTVARAEPSNSDSDSAKAHYDRGVSRYALGQYADAAEEYERAFALKPGPELLYDAAQAHRQAGHKERALTLYQNYLAIYTESPYRDTVRSRVAELSKAIASEKEAQKATAAPPKTAPTTATTTTVTAAIAAPPPPLYRRAALGWGLFVPGVALAAAGGGLLGYGANLNRRTPSSAQQLIDYENAASSSQIAGAVLIGVGGLALVAGSTVLVLSHQHRGVRH